MLSYLTRRAPGSETSFSNLQANLVPQTNADDIFIIIPKRDVSNFADDNTFYWKLRIINLNQNIRSESKPCDVLLNLTIKYSWKFTDHIRNLVKKAP